MAENTKPSAAQFTVLWSNDNTHNRPMLQHSITLRDGCPSGGLYCGSLFLDQVFVLFRPNGDIAAGELVAGDTANYNWRAETSQLLIKTKPGFSHVLYNVKPSAAMSTGITPVRQILYSNAYALNQNMENVEDYWCRTYRPVRDTPVAIDLRNVSDLSIELIFPLLMDNPVLQTLPNYRILSVMCEFSYQD